MDCPRNAQIDCYYVRTQAQADKCLLPNQNGARWSCQAQGDQSALDFKDQSAVFQELAQKLFTDDNHSGNLYRQSPDLVRKYEERANDQLCKE